MSDRGRYSDLWSTEKRAMLMRLFDAGAAPPEMAAKLGMTEAQVRGKLQRDRLRLGERDPYQEAKEAASVLEENGWSMIRIADLLKEPVQKVRRWRHDGW